ncbi:MAG: hypothetical protein ABTQ32_02935 [Myxococcaceae bacterium]
MLRAALVCSLFGFVAHAGRPLTAAIDGKPVRLTHALAWTNGERAVSLRLSERALGCDELWNAGLLVELVVAPMLIEPVDAQKRFGWSRPATETWRVTWASWPHGAGADPTSTVKLEPAVRRGANGRVELATKVNFMTSNVVKSLELSGAIAVKGCGDRPRAGLELSKPPLVTVSGEPVQVRGATFQREFDGRPGSWALTLSSVPAQCGGRQQPDVEVAIRALPRRPKSPTQTVTLDVSGKRVGQQVAQQVLIDAGVLPTPRVVDGGVEVDLALDFEALGSVRGVVTALDCSR